MSITLKRYEDQVEFRADGAVPDRYHLDVRELILEGGSPYEIIMDCVAQITDTASLVVHAIFEPKPLIRQLRRMGLAVGIEQVGADHWAVTVQRPQPG